MFQNVMREPSSGLFLAILTAAFSGVPGLFLGKGQTGQRLATLCALTASGLALPVILYKLLAQETVSYLFEWNLPFGPCAIALDPLSLFFLIPIFIVFPLGALYANGYWPAQKNRSSQPPLTFFYGLLAASMAVVVVARNGVLFLMAWEIMALSGYFLLVTEHEKPEVRQAGTVYLIASHVGVAALFVLFSLLARVSGSFLFPDPAVLQQLQVSATPLFIAALIGFGSKAGLMPLHIWLPSAHANAPSHVSALLSGVMLKMGIYGLLRMISLIIERPHWLGWVLLVSGLTSALLGISLAAAQKDLKRLLAYSSIENLGIIATAVGAALIGDASGDGRLAFLAMTGGLFHVLNHSLFKPLLFFSAGGVIHATGTRDLDSMGGLGKRMPQTAWLTLVGVIAICGLPPGNGFVSEFLIYLGFFGQALAPIPYLALGAPLLALVGGIAVLSFVKLYGVAFLGAPRSIQAGKSHESPRSMLVPMAVLALLSLLGGLYPQAFLALVEPLVATLVPVSREFSGLPVASAWFGIMGGGLIVLGLLLGLFLKGKVARRGIGSSATWGCGYLAPTARMQYTGTSFSEIFVRLWGGMVKTRVRRTPVAGVTPATASLECVTQEIILERVITPGFRLVGIGCSFLRRLQHGEVQIYILYIFATLILLMLWVH